MIPSAIPPTIRIDPKRSGEVAVFDAIARDPLLEGFSVWYSPRWLADYRGVLRDGEADFIVAHPKIGFLSVEVKGGRVRRDAATGTWWSKDRDGNDNAIENPVEQALKSKKVLLNYILKRWPDSPFIWNRHGVILPNGSRPKAPMNLGAAMPLEIFAFSEDLPTIGARLMQMLLWQPDGSHHAPSAFGEHGMNLIEQFCGRDVAFDLSLKAEVEETEREIVKLTDDQNRLLDALQNMKRASFQGGAGTGKTALAVEKARRLATAGRSVLLLCFNRPLRTDLRAKLGDCSVEVMTFHELCSQVCSQAGIRPERTGSEQQFYSEELPRALEDAVLEDGIRRYDAVLVDEAQDFKADWLHAVSALLTSDRDGIFYLFSDDNQNLYKGAGLGLSFGPTIPLCDNFRNARPIFDVSVKFYQGEQLRCRGPSGSPVRWIDAPKERLVRTVERQLNTLVLTEGFAHEDIAVLTGCAVERSAFAGSGSIGEHPVCSAEESAGRQVTLDSVYRFKGLDRPVVILADMDGVAVTNEVPYVGLTRAKSLLIVVASEATLRTLGRP